MKLRTKVLSNLGLKIRGFKSRAVYNGARTVGRDYHDIQTSSYSKGHYHSNSKQRLGRGSVYCYIPKGAFNNHVDRILPFFDPLSPLPPVRGQFLYHERGQKQIFFDPLPHHLVHVVIECPLIMFEIGTVRAPSLAALD